MMGEWGIANYRPRWCDSATELLKLLDRTSIVGQSVRSIWSWWDDESDSWFEDAPIVICTPIYQLEFCNTKIGKFSVSFDSIDLTSPVYWCGTVEDGIDPFSWVEGRNIEFRDLVGKTITGIEIIEAEIESDFQDFIGMGQWILAGIAILFDRERLEIRNGLDCNLLSRERITDGSIRIQRILSID